LESNRHSDRRKAVVPHRKHEESLMSPEALTPPAGPGAPSRRSRDRLVVGIAAGALAVATLAAGAGWMLRGAQENPVAVAAADVPAQRLDDRGPAPDDGPRPPTVADSKPAPVADAPAPVRREPPPVPSTRAPVAAAPTPAPARQVAVCVRCGVVESVRPVQREGEANGVGAVAGGVLGAVVGNQIGGGNGRKAMTVLGAVGGGYAGHEVEKRVRSETWYEARVRMDDGSLRTVTQRQAAAAGSRVVVENGRLRAPTAADERLGS
jgi:outer membrane lipoprotein SlyB